MIYLNKQRQWRLSPEFILHVIVQMFWLWNTRINLNLLFDLLVVELCYLMTIRNEPRSKLRNFPNVNIKAYHWVTSIHLKVLQPGSFKLFIKVIFAPSVFLCIFFLKCSKQNYSSSFFPFLQIYYSQPFDMIWYDMIYLSTAIGLTPGGSSTVHIYT